MQPAPKAPAVRRSAKDKRSDKIVESATIAMIRGDMLRARAWLDDALEVNPAHHGLLVEKARYLMLEEREAADKPLGYRLPKAIDARVRAMLEEVIEADETHPRALYLLAELHTTQGRLEEAERLIDSPEAAYTSARYGGYNEMLLRIARGEYAEAIAGVAASLDKAPRGVERNFMFQQTWARVKGVVIAHPELDPLPLAREGLITRVASDSLLEEIKRRSESETPLLVILTSEDPHCSYCVGNGRDIEPFVRANEDKYDVIYTSVEPWRNISYQDWMHVIPNITGVPRGVLFARSRYMASSGIPVSEEQIAWYEQIYPRMQSESPRLWNYPKREARAELMVAFRLWQVLDAPVAAFASVLTDDDFAWGSSNDVDATQAQVEERAMTLCTEKARGKGIDKPCALYEADEG